MKEYNVQVKVRNNYLLSMMRQFGYETAAQFSRASSVSQCDIGKYLNLKATPFKKNGELTAAVEKMCAALVCSVYDIFPAEHLESALESNVGETEMDFQEVTALVSPDSPEFLAIAKESKDALYSAIASMGERESRFITQHYGFEDGHPKTVAQIARDEDISFSRAHEIIRKAHGRLWVKLSANETH